MLKDTDTNEIVNSIADMAEHAIYTQTGLRRKVIIVDEIQTPKGLLAVMALALGMKATDYKVPTRATAYAELRHMGCYFLRQYFDTITLGDICKLMGFVSHTSVIHSTNAVNDLLDGEDKNFRRKYHLALSAVTQYMVEL
jgi:chromosomal replication initiation ATPase DnaA